MHTTEKQLALKAVQDLPADASLMDAMDSLLVVHKIEKGLRQKDAGQTVSHEDAKMGEIVKQRDRREIEIAISGV